MNRSKALRGLSRALIAAGCTAACFVRAVPPDAPPDYETLTTGLSLGLLYEPQLGEGTDTALSDPYITHFGDEIENAGFTSVRLRIDMDQFWASSGPAPDYTLSTNFMHDLELVVTNLLARRTNSMYVIVSPKGLEDGTALSEQIMSNWWKQIAVKFQHQTHRLIFNLMNEPNINSSEFGNLAQIESMYRALTDAIRPSNPTRYLVYYRAHHEYMDGTNKVKNTPYSDAGPGETDFNHCAIPTNAGPYRIYDFHVLGDESLDGEDKRTACIRQAWEFRQFSKYPVWSGAWNYGAWDTAWDTGAVARVTQKLKDANIAGTYLMFNASLTSLYDSFDSDRNNNGIHNEWTQPDYPPIITARNPIVWNSNTLYPINSFHAQSDAYVKANLPGEVNGEGNYLLVKDLGGGMARSAFLKFNLVRQPFGPVSSAILKVRAYMAPGDTIQVRLAAHSNWDERNLAFSNAPAFGSVVCDSQVIGSSNTWYEFNVTTAITNNGTYTFVLTSTGTGLTAFYSRDADWLSGPDLIVTTDLSWTNTIGMSVASATDTNVTLTLTGPAGLPGNVPRATNLLAPVAWVNINTNRFGTNGQFAFADNFAGLPVPLRSCFYRLTLQP